MNKPSLLAMSLSVVLVLAPLSAMAAEKTFVINDESHRDVVNFTSDAAVELIKGTTTNIDGTIRYDEGLKFDAAHPYKVNFTVDLPSIDTGIGLRNEHLRENFLET